MSLNMRQLQHLLLLADELHFARAAERAFISQSAFSRSIQALEAAIGMKLFDRDLRNVRPTPAGTQMIQRARRLLASAGDLTREMDMLRSGDLGHVTMGTGPFSGMTLVSGALAEMQRVHPEVRVLLNVADGPTLLQQLDDEQIDFFVAEIRELPPRNDCSVERLGWMAGGFYCQPNHPLATGKPLSLVDFRDSRFASVHMPLSMKLSLDEAMRAQTGREFTVALESESFVILRDVALSSDVILLAFPNAVQHEVDSGILRRLRVPEFDDFEMDTPLRTEIGLVKLRDRTQLPASDILMRLIREQSRNKLTDDKPRSRLRNRANR